MEKEILEDTGSINCSDVVKLNDADYGNCSITFDGNTAKVSLVGKGKFEGMAVCNANKNSATVSSDSVVISEADIVEGGILCEVGVGREFSWRELARLAIVISDNSASNLIIKKLGFKFINSFISNVLQVRQTVLRRYFMASPQEMGENYTSAQDLASIMALLWQGNILDKTYHEEFWAILSRQQFIEKLPSRIFSKVKNYNKTGELDDGARHDVAVFAHDNQVWGLVALTDQQEVPDWQIDLAMGAWSEQIFNLLTK